MKVDLKKKRSELSRAQQSQISCTVCVSKKTSGKKLISHHCARVHASNFLLCLFTAPIPLHFKLWPDSCFFYKEIQSTVLKENNSELSWEMMDHCHRFNQHYYLGLFAEHPRTYSNLSWEVKPELCCLLHNGFSTRFYSLWNLKWKKVLDCWIWNVGNCQHFPSGHVSKAFNAKRREKLIRLLLGSSRHYTHTHESGFNEI